MFKRWAVGLAVLMCWVPVQVFALGLGNIEMRSALNQALDARIELLRARPGELKDLSITLASADTFKRAGMERPAFLTLLRFDVVTNPGGAPYIQVKSAQPITEPFLNFLIEVNWPNGRLLREFTVLVDPPVLSERAPGAVEAPVTQPTETSSIDRSVGEAPAAVVAPVATGAIEVPVPPARTKPVEPLPAVAPEVTPEAPLENQRPALEAEPAAPKPAPEIAKSRPRPRPTRVAPPKPVEEEKPAATVAEGGTEYKVKANDTMWGIASKMRPGGAVSVPQMMIALLQSNPEAFIGNNINNLKQGSVLRLSDASAASSISKEEAMRITDLQWDQWKSSRGTTVGSAPSRTGRPKVVAPSVDARVKLVSPNISGAAGGRNAPKAAATGGARDPAQAKQELAIAQESLDAQRRETQDMRERVAGLEEQVNTMTRLVQLKDDQLAALQNQPKGKKPDAASKAAESEPAAAGGKSDAAKSAEVAAEAPRASGLMARVMNDPKLIGLAVVVAGIVVLLVWLVVRRRKMQQFQESILTLNDSVAEPGFTQNKPDSEDASFMSDFAVSSMEGIQTEISEVDPLSEADVYLAYGRYKQAEELVSQAIEKNPQRAELKMKLLEIHYAAKEGEAFAQQAESVRDNFSAKHPEMWARVLEMGRELAPKNPLFGGAGAAPRKASKAVDEPDLGDLNFGTDNDAHSTEDTLLGLEPSGSGSKGAGSKAKNAKPVALDETALDMDIELTLHDKKSGKGHANEQALDFDLSAFDEAEKASAAGAQKQDDGLDFDLSAFEQAEEKAVIAAASKAAKPASPKDDGLDIDFGTAQTAAKPQLAAAKRDANVLDFNVSNADSGAEDHLLDQPNSEVALADGGIDGELDDALFADVDEIGTKLDLAKAYIDMGDSEGARSILDEVIEEGNDNQKQEAQVLMRQIA